MKEQTDGRLHRYLKRLLTLLIVMTLLAMGWQYYRGDAVMVIDGQSALIMGVVDDRAVANENGTSVATLRREGGNLILECDIGAGYAWPFCEIAIALKEPPQGVDFTRYDRVNVRLSVEGPSEPQMRFFIRNYNPAYSDVEELTTLKPMEILFTASEKMATYTARLNQFNVASWWTNTFRLDLEHAGVEVNNVTQISITTGGHMVPGRHRIVVESIEFKGKTISDARLRLIIIVVWISTIMGYMFLDKLIARHQLTLTKQKHLSLHKINEALMLENQSYEKMAYHDALTGVLNRHGLRNVLVDAAQLNDPRLFPLSLAFLDIDHFKKLNDTMGHAIGDQVLKDLADLIKEIIKRDDLITRWGGEEFLLMFPGTTAAQATSVVQRVREAMTEHTWPHGESVTCSIGITEARKGEDLSAAIERADDAMYRAKRNGRDRIEVN